MISVVEGKIREPCRAPAGLILEVKKLRKVLKYIYWLTGAAFIAYYFVIGYASRFGLDMSWMWPLGGTILLLAGFACLTDRIPQWMRYVWRGLLCAGIVLVLVLECFVVSGMFRQGPDGLDYIIVLGARVENDGSPSPALRRRLNRTLEYLEENPETIVIASGGQGSDEVITEAECIRNELVAAGIEEKRILTESRSTKTSENLVFSKELMTSPDAEVGLVTNNFHVFRAVKLAEKAGLTNVHGVAAKYTGYTLLHYMIREAACTIADFYLGNL